MSKNVRNIAASVLLQVDQGQSLNTALPHALEQISERDRPLLQQLCYGTLRFYPRLEWVLKKLLSKPLKAKERELQQLLLLGLYQVLMTRIPAHAAINETVQAVTSLGKGWAKGLTNAVLRNAQRQQAQLEQEWEGNELAATAHPAWLITKLKQAWPEQWQSICANNNLPAPMTLRVNQRHGSREEYLQRLTQADIPAFTCSCSNDGITLEKPCDIQKLPGFAAGNISVQDEAAQLSSLFLEPAPGEKVLDACAAPGGKTCHLLEHCDNKLDLIALDADATRLLRVDENLDRLQLNAQTLCANAATPEQWWDGQLFDRILLDAPCSATGVIRRHPDIKRLRQKDDIKPLVNLQADILKSLWSTLKPGGTLLYATCSILPEENAEQIERFLANTVDAKLIPLNITLGIDTGFGRQLLPKAQGSDGFFYARLEKLK